jgi:hypothetical protein
MEPVSKVSPQAHLTTLLMYLGCMPSFIYFTSEELYVMYFRIHAVKKMTQKYYTMFLRICKIYFPAAIFV